MKTQYIVILLAIVPLKGFAQEVNYEESLVSDYVLPDVLKAKDGRVIATKKDWESSRRLEILDMFAKEMYGVTPRDSIAVKYELLKENKQALEGLATIRQVKFIFSNGQREHEALLLLHIPNRKSGKVPVFVGYNFRGNHSTTLDTAILYSSGFSLMRSPDHPDWTRGSQMERWPYETIIERGYAVATMCYHDIYPDNHDMRKHSVASLFSSYKPNLVDSSEWGAIGVWAWGLSRILDYLLEETWVDTERVAVMGHSRQGKATLWAGAQDTRFKVVISNNSGCGGAALSRRNYGETIAKITTSFPHWFCLNFEKYANQESSLPFDQHFLTALIAPRALYVASAEEDRWADPKGEYLGAYYARKVYELYGLRGLPTETMPEINRPVMHNVGYHIRTGKHAVTNYDWQRFLDFTDLHFDL
ncbi:prolyl oligopeptidase family serine peptidase [Parapusillimonas sp. SGNA-6]|nr:prolyl oligopeptidase family serine peptidase [Parapusillimonas sp. SGNA-6]